jgi:predicted HAD superfamily Cof-like phosphohydrolase
MKNDTFSTVATQNAFIVLIPESWDWCPYKNNARIKTQIGRTMTEKITMNPFKDQEWFMTACDQTTTEYNQQQYLLYRNLIREEFGELETAHDLEAELDALIDILVVTIGAIHSAGFNAEGAWDEVMRSNAAKIDLDTGKVRKREDGKVLKPADWRPPNLTPFLRRE